MRGVLGRRWFGLRMLPSRVEPMPAPPPIVAVVGVGASDGASGGAPVGNLPLPGYFPCLLPLRLSQKGEK